MKLFINCFVLYPYTEISVDFMHVSDVFYLEIHVTLGFLHTAIQLSIIALTGDPDPQ